MVTPEIMDDLVKAYEANQPVLVFCEGLPIGRQIRIKRAHDNLSLAQLSEMTKIPKTTLCEVERGRRSIPRKHKKIIDDYLHHMYFEDGEYQWWD